MHFLLFYDNRPKESGNNEAKVVFIVEEISGRSFVIFSGRYCAPGKAEMLR